MRRAFGLLVCGALALLLGGCGSAPAPRPGPTVKLTMQSPANGLSTAADQVTVTGQVSPARARVLVLGRPVQVAATGDFSTPVHLAPGANLIDVLASAPRSAGALTALRVTRFLLVTVPSVTGQSPAAATQALKALGLNAKVKTSGVPLSFLVPFSTEVCSTSPAAGARVDPGTTVTLVASKLCLFAGKASPEQAAPAPAPTGGPAGKKNGPGGKPKPPKGPGGGHGHGHGGGGD